MSGSSSLIVIMIVFWWLSTEFRLKRIESLLHDINFKIPEPKPSLEYLDALASLAEEEK